MAGEQPEQVTSYSGIPEAEFVDDVDAFMQRPENSEGVEKVLRRLDEQHGKYKFMEYTLAAKRRRLRQQIPDLSRSLEMMDMLASQKEELETQFLLSEQVFMKANVKPTKTVCLWLGANVMLEYTLDDAKNLLSSNMASAKKNLACIEHDLDYLRVLPDLQQKRHSKEWPNCKSHTDMTQAMILNMFLNHFRDQWTTTEVNMARVYNWDVKRRQSAVKPVATA